MPVEKKCDVYDLPIFYNREWKKWDLFWFALRHPTWWALCDGCGIWFMSAHRGCVQYELMECGNEMSRQDLYEIREGRAWKFLVLHIVMRIRFRVRYHWMFRPRLLRRRKLDGQNRS